MNELQKQKKFQHLPNAPITEAIIDIRAKLPEGFDVKIFKSLKPILEKEFPKIVEMGMRQVQFQIVPAQAEEKLPVAKDLGIHGYFFQSTDGKNVAQFRRDGFTFNRLHPYTSWEEIFYQASELWSLYLKTASPVDVPKIAIRYINRIQLPLPIEKFEKYLKTTPILPVNCPQFVSGFLNRVTIHEPDLNITAIITQALEGGDDGKYVPVILDIEVSQPIVFDSDNERLLARFSKLREMKNEIFFGSITEETIKLFL
jgi:uncharacterized protein (TIGR04255 family)